MSETSRPARGPEAGRGESANLTGTPKPFVLTWFERYWLAVWFFVVTGVRLTFLDFSHVDRMFLDGQLYLEATRTWLLGGDPFTVVVHGLSLAAPPPTLLPLVPFAILPPAIGLVLLAVALVGSAVLTIRLLRLPWWWLAFPPLVECVITGNAHGLLLPLMLTGRGWLAILIKIYAAVPLAILGQWRQLVLAAAAILITIPILPWGSYISKYADISARYAETSRAGLPAEVLLVMVPFALLAFLIVGREKAAWLSVPALWPSPQPYYSTLGMPTRSAVAMAVIAFPLPQPGLFALFALAAAHVVEWYRIRRTAPKIVT